MYSKKQVIFYFTPLLSFGHSCAQDHTRRVRSLLVVLLLLHQVVPHGTKGTGLWFVTRSVFMKSHLDTTQRSLVGYLGYVFISSSSYSLSR